MVCQHVILDRSVNYRVTLDKEIWIMNKDKQIVIRVDSKLYEQLVKASEQDLRTVS